MVEFPKRGLPHAHILLIMEKRDRPVTAEDVDRRVCAEIPDERQPALRAAVMHHMLHGPCGTRYPQAGCMEHGVCKKGYPKTFRSATELVENSYPLYRRRNNGQTLTKGGPT